MDPKDRNPADPVDFGPGMKADGSVNVMTEEQARAARAARDVEDTTFDDEMLEPDDVPTVESMEKIADEVAGERG